MPSLLKLMAELGLNVKPFEAGLKQSEKLAQQTGDVLASKFKGFVASYFGFKAFDALIVKTIDRAREIKHLSDQFQITTAEVQYLGKAAGKVGLDMEDFGTALDKLGTARKEAIESSIAMREEFARFGISLQMLNDPSVRNIDLLKQMGVALQNLGQTTQRDRNTFRDMFGRSGARLIEALKQYSEDTGKIVSDKDIQNIYQAERALIQLRKQWEILASKPIGAAAEEMAKFLKVAQSDKVPAWRRYLEDARAVLDPLSFGKYATILQKAFPVDKMTSTKVFGRGANRAPGGNVEEQLYQDQIAARSRFELGKSEAQLQKTVGDFLFQRLTRENQIVQLKRQQAEISSQLVTNENALAELQLNEQDRNATLQARNDLMEEQIRIQGKITDLETKGDLSKVAAVRGAGAAIAAFQKPNGTGEVVRVNGKQLTTQEQILQLLRDNIPGKNTITFSQ